MWTIRPQAGPGTESTVVSKPPAVTPPARTRRRPGRRASRDGRISPGG